MIQLKIASIRKFEQTAYLISFVNASMRLTITKLYLQRISSSQNMSETKYAKPLFLKDAI